MRKTCLLLGAGTALLPLGPFDAQVIIGHKKGCHHRSITLLKCRGALAFCDGLDEKLAGISCKDTSLARLLC